MKRALEYILFCLFILVFFLNLFVFDILQRLAVPFGQKVVDRVVHYFNCCLVMTLRIVGCRLRLTYQHELPDSGPAIIVSNHQSMFDIPFLHYALKVLRPRFVSKKELGKGIPGISTCLRVSHAALIDRSDPSQALTEIKRFSMFLKAEKVSGVIFPEGTRARDGVLKPFKKRGLDTLLKKTLPCWIVPVTLDNSWRLQSRKYGPIPLGIEIKLNIGKPLYVSEQDSIEGIADQIHAQIAFTLQEIRSN